MALHYALKVHGDLVEAHCGYPPFRYLHGAGNIVPGLERALRGRRAGDRLSVVVPPEEGYGPAHPEFVKRISRADFPPDVEPILGMRFGSAVGDRTVLPARVTEIGEHEVTVDFNHPLAGETLCFAVVVLDVRPASPEEQFRGRPQLA